MMEEEKGEMQDRFCAGAPAQEAASTQSSQVKKTLMCTDNLLESGRA